MLYYKIEYYFNQYNKIYTPYKERNIMESVFTVRIGGLDLTLYSTETAEYTNQIAEAIDAKIKDILASNPSLSLTNASLLVCMDLYDEIVKLQTSADNMRDQLKEYLDGTTKALAERDEARRMSEKLRDELLALKIDISKNGNN